MRQLFVIDTGDYDPAGKAFVRHSARSIIIRDGRIAMVYSRLYNYYKFPGGGIEDGETHEQAIIRETREEAGLTVILASVRPYGYVHRVQKSHHGDAERFIQDNFYYLCEAEAEAVSQMLDDYEAEEGFTLTWVEPQTAIAANRHTDHGPKDQNMLEREAKVLEILTAEGYFGDHTT